MKTLLDIIKDIKELYPNATDEQINTVLHSVPELNILENVEYKDGKLFKIKEA